MIVQNRGFKVSAILLVCLVLVQNSKQDKSWSMSNVKEPQCKKCSCVGTPLDEKHKANILKILNQRTYQPLKGKCAVMFTSILLRGKGILSNSNVDQMCYTSTYDQNLGVKVNSMGIGNEVNYTYSYTLKKFSIFSVYNTQQLHDPLEMSETLATTYKFMTAPRRQNIVWTDGTSMLITICRFNGESCWFVDSTKRALDRRTKKIVLKKITALGFDPMKTYSADYSACS